MDEGTQQLQPETAKDPVQQPVRRSRKKVLVWLLILILLASNILFAFLWYRANQKNTDYKKETTKLHKQIDALEKKVAENDMNEDEAPSDGDEAAEACKDVASASLKANIKAALDTKNTAAFATYTTNPVHYVLAASEYGGDVSSAEAATSLEYTHSATGPWDFNLPAATIAAYDAGFYTNYFNSNTYVGRAASGMVVAFDFNCSDKIKNIFVAADEDLL